jgi:acetyl-CoA carboxylase carboxyl transferase subunit beta
MSHPTARERIARLARAFDEQDADLRSGDPIGFPGYVEQLRSAQSETGLVEGCIWGWAEIPAPQMESVRCALVVGDFRFLGGSMGVVVGEKVARTFDAAHRERASVVTVTASGGARMQEGMAALVQMAKVVEARRVHAAAGLAHITLLTSPTTGGVYASFASFADVILAEPQATVGFAGPRVVAELTGNSPSPRVHTSEFAFEHGLIDAIVPERDQQRTIGRLLEMLTPKRLHMGGATRWLETGTEPKAEPTHDRLTGWESLRRSRDPARPKASQIVDALLPTSFELRGDRSGAPDDQSVLTRIGGMANTQRNVVVIAQESSGDRRIRPQGFRKAVRAIEVAGRLGLPLVTLVDTRGADPLPSSEGHGVASAIADTFRAMLDCPSPTLAVVVGEGGSGGALSMAVADHVMAWENAVFSVIAPEAAATILYRDPGRAPELAESLRITSSDLEALGIVDEVISEPPAGAQSAPELAVQELADAVASRLNTLAGQRSATRMRRRHRRWRYIQQA